MTLNSHNIRLPLSLLHLNVRFTYNFLGPIMYQKGAFNAAKRKHIVRTHQKNLTPKITLKECNKDG